MTPDERRAVERARKIITKMMRPTYVMQMASAAQDVPGAEKRMINAANEILEIIKDEADG